MVTKLTRSTKLFFVGTLCVGAFAITPAALAQGGTPLTQAERDNFSQATANYLVTGFGGEGFGGFGKSWAAHASNHAMEGVEELVQRAVSGEATASDLERMRGTGFFALTRSEVKQVARAALKSGAARLAWSKKHSDRITLVIPKVADLPNLRPTLKAKLKENGGVVGVSLNSEGDAIVLDHGIKIVLATGGKDLTTAELSLVTVFAVEVGDRGSKELTRPRSTSPTSPSSRSPRRCSGEFDPKHQQWPALPASPSKTPVPSRVKEVCSVAVATQTKTARPSTPTAADVEADLKALIGDRAVESWEELAVEFEVKEQRASKMRQALQGGTVFKPKGSK